MPDMPVLNQTLENRMLTSHPWSAASPEKTVLPQRLLLSASETLM